MGAFARVRASFDVRLPGFLRDSSWRAVPRDARRPVFSIAVLAFALAFAAGLHVNPPAVPITLIQTQAGGWAVESVAVGSAPWVNGVRPGMPVVAWPSLNGYGASGFDVTVGESTYGVSTHQLPPHAAFLTVAATSALLALALRLGRLPGAGPAAALASGLALMPLAPLIGLPIALLLMPVPVVAGAYLLDLPHPALRRMADRLAVGAAVATVAIAAVALVVEPPSWSALWALPLVTGVAFAIAGDVVAVVWRYRHAGAVSVGAHRVASALAPMLVQSSLAGADRQRSLIADDIHNRVLPVLNHAIRGMRNGAPTEASVDHIVDVGRELRSMMARDETVTLELAGLGEAIRTQIALAATDIPVGYRSAAGMGRPPRVVELAAYRVAQVALDNAIRHSGGDHIDVELSVDGRSVELTVRDDGVGLDSETASSLAGGGRVGLAQMRVRAEAVNGSLTIAGTPGIGTEVRFRWPK